MPAGDPVYADEVEFSEQAPMGRMVASTTQALATAVQVALQFPTEQFDTHNQHDTVTNNTRVTPNVAGIYSFRGTAFIGTPSSGNVSSYDANFRLNGTQGIAPGARLGGSAGLRVGAATMEAVSLEVEVTVAMNGTTDYVEFLARQTGGVGVSTNQSAQFSSTVEWKRERALP